MIKIRDLWKSYGNHQVLKGLSLDIEKGETLVIIGRSGVGKSVLLKQIIGIEKPDEGSVWVEGIDISRISERERFKIVKNMGMLFQGGALFDSLNILENVAFYLREHGEYDDDGKLRKISDSEVEDRVAETLKMVGLEGVEEKMPSDLSGGMRKRAALARIVIYRPRILLYDEPTTGLDPITAMHISEMILRIQEELDATSIVVTHDMMSAMTVADHLALHQDGKIAHACEKEKFIKIDDPLIQEFLKNGLP